jgi:hypothetical protein
MTQFPIILFLEKKYYAQQMLLLGLRVGASNDSVF